MSHFRPSPSPGGPSRPPIYLASAPVSHTPPAGDAPSRHVSASSKRRARTSAFDSFDAPAYCSDMAAYIAEQLASKQKRMAPQGHIFEARQDGWRGAAPQRAQLVANASVQTEQRQSSDGSISSSGSDDEQGLSNEDEGDQEEDGEEESDSDEDSASIDEDSAGIDEARAERTKAAAESFLQQLQGQADDVSEAEKVLEQQVLSLFAGVPGAQHSSTQAEDEMESTVQPEVRAQIADMLAEPAKTNGPLIEMVDGKSNQEEDESDDGSDVSVISESEEAGSEDESPQPASPAGEQFDEGEHFDDDSDHVQNRTPSGEHMQWEERDGLVSDRGEDQDSMLELQNSDGEEEGAGGAEREGLPYWEPAHRPSLPTSETIEVLDSDDEGAEDNHMEQEEERDEIGGSPLEDKLQEEYLDDTDGKMAGTQGSEGANGQVELFASNMFEQPGANAHLSAISAGREVDQTAGEPMTTGVEAAILPSSMEPLPFAQPLEDESAPAIPQGLESTASGADLVLLKQHLREGNQPISQPASIMVHPGTPQRSLSFEGAKGARQGHARHARDLFQIKSAAEGLLHGQDPAMSSLATSVASDVGSLPVVDNRDAVGSAEAVMVTEVEPGDNNEVFSDYLEVPTEAMAEDASSMKVVPVLEVSLTEGATTAQEEMASEPQEEVAFDAKSVTDDVQSFPQPTAGIHGTPPVEASLETENKTVSASQLGGQAELVNVDDRSEEAMGGGNLEQGMADEVVVADEETPVVNVKADEQADEDGVENGEGTVRENAHSGSAKMPLQIDKSKEEEDRPEAAAPVRSAATSRHRHFHSHASHVRSPRKNNDSSEPHSPPQMTTRQHCSYQLVTLDCCAFVLPSCAIDYSELAPNAAVVTSEASEEDNEQKEYFELNDLEEQLYQRLVRVMGGDTFTEVACLPQGKPAYLATHRGSDEDVARDMDARKASPVASVSSKARSAPRASRSPVVTRRSLRKSSSRAPSESPSENMKRKRRSRHTRQKSDASGDLADYVPEEEEELDEESERQRKRAKGEDEADDWAISGEGDDQAMMDVSVLEDSRSDEYGHKDDQQEASPLGDTLLDASVPEDSQQDASLMDIDDDKTGEAVTGGEEVAENDGEETGEKTSPRRRRRSAPRKSIDPSFRLTKLEPGSEDDDEETKEAKRRKEEQQQKRNAADRERRRVQRQERQQAREAEKKEEAEAERLAAGVLRKKRLSEDAKTFRPSAPEADDEGEEVTSMPEPGPRRSRRRVSQAPT